MLTNALKIVKHGGPKNLSCLHEANRNIPQPLSTPAWYLNSRPDDLRLLRFLMPALHFGGRPRGKFKARKITKHDVVGGPSTSRPANWRRAWAILIGCIRHYFPKAHSHTLTVLYISSSPVITT